MSILALLLFLLIIIIPVVIIIGFIVLIPIFKYASSTPDQIQDKNSGFAIASLTLGVINLFSWIIPPCGLIMTILGLIFGYMSRNTSRRGMSVAGMVLSAIGLVASVINSIVGIYLGVTGQLF